MGFQIDRWIAVAQTMNQSYLDTARLLTKVAPFVFSDGLFALKGGTAINLFIRDMPRLSVDLDLVFVDHVLSREQALEQINGVLRQAAERLTRAGFQTRLPVSQGIGETKLLVRRDKIEVKVEVNYVMRGTIFPVQTRALTSAASDRLMADLEIPVASIADVYGGKLVAAMDRQHPRDLFDVMELFQHEGITSDIRRAFVVYLASHNRPVHEVLFGARKVIDIEYEQNFKGMTAATVGLDQLLNTRERMFTEIQSSLTVQERGFLLSLVANRPEWDLLDIPHLHQLPALRWKVSNLGTVEESKSFKICAAAKSPGESVAINERLRGVIPFVSLKSDGLVSTPSQWMFQRLLAKGVPPARQTGGQLGRYGEINWGQTPINAVSAI